MDAPEDEEESQAELQRQAYEQESAELLSEDEEDWDAIERAHNRELMVRLAVQVVASLLTLGFVASLLWARYQQLQGKGGAPASEAKASAAAEAPPTATLKVEGMTCEGCRSKVEKALAAVEGVTAASVELESKLATITGLASADSLIAAVEAAGKKAELIAVKAKEAKPEKLKAVKAKEEKQAKEKDGVKDAADEAKIEAKTGGEKEAEAKGEATEAVIKETKKKGKARTPKAD